MIPFFDIHTHHINSEIISVKNCFPQEITSFLTNHPLHYCSVGLHPWHIESDFEAQLALVAQHASEPKVLAVGEAGLDKICSVPMDLQLEVFRRQIAISEQCQKPLIIHCVKAYAELLALKKELKPRQAWILHAFRGNAILAKQLLDHGFYFSFGKGMELLSETLRELPLDHLFLETDDSKLSIESRYEILADSRALSMQELKLVIQQNFTSLFANYL